MDNKRKDDIDEVRFVTCPECGNEQADMGANVACEECGEGPMPYKKPVSAPEKAG